MIDMSEHTTNTDTNTDTNTVGPPATPTPHYVPPDRFTRRVFNPAVSRLTRWGVSVWGSRILEVPGRTTGVVRATPVNVLDHDGRRYLVAPRGVTQWVRNVRAAGSADLRVGRRREHVTLVELHDGDKPEILRAYLRRWKWEVGQFFDGVDADASDEALARIAARHPVFEITT
jgi:deazaflavin-dependent oxidoreductase (nitroreductase family)